MLPNSRLHHVLLAGEAHRNKESATAGLDDGTWPVALVDSMNYGISIPPNGHVGNLTLPLTTEDEWYQEETATKLKEQLAEIMKRYGVLHVGIVTFPQTGAKGGYLSPAILSMVDSGGAGALEWTTSELKSWFMTNLWEYRQKAGRFWIFIGNEMQGTRSGELTGPNTLRYKRTPYTREDDRFPNTPPRPRRGM